VTRRLRPALPYDVDGRLAAAGAPVDAVVDALLADPYFAAPPPKSTGRELFGVAYADALIARARAAHAAAADEDLVATAVALTARSVADAYARFLPEPVDEVLLSGGGARNPALVAAIAREVGRRAGAPRVRAFDEVFFDGEAKEAVAFALLGWLHLARRPGNVPGATGAGGPRVLGKLTPA
jgi:anhydro-N-acetylmuramic acid kinase